MFCSKCGAEYREGFDRCSECGVPLDETPATGPGPGPDPNLELVTILETADASAVPVVQSILQAAGIPFFVRDLHSLGMRPRGGFFGAASPELGAAIQVPADRVDEARALLEPEEA
ncbi:MAG: putative signal transducing protein [Thermoanaerobaculia bacterium]